MPAYNESKYIASLITEAKKYVSVVIVVDDGSRDGTYKEAEQAGAEVHRHQVNAGYGRTVQDLIKLARGKEFDAFVIMDSDSQHFPSDIPRLARYILEGYDMVIASRSYRNVPIYRGFGGMILNLFIGILSGVWLHDTQSGFRAYSPKAVWRLNPKETSMGISSELCILAKHNFLKTFEVPVEMRYTADSSTLNPVYQGFYTLARIVAIAMRMK